MNMNRLETLVSKVVPEVIAEVGEREGSKIFSTRGKIYDDAVAEDVVLEIYDEVLARALAETTPKERKVMANEVNGGLSSVGWEFEIMLGVYERIWLHDCWFEAGRKFIFVED